MFVLIVVHIAKLLRRELLGHIGKLLSSGVSHGRAGAGVLECGSVGASTAAEHGVSGLYSGAFGFVSVAVAGVGHQAWRGARAR